MSLSVVKTIATLTMTGADDAADLGILSTKCEELRAEIKRLLVARIQVGQRLTRAERRFHLLEAQADKLIANAERRVEAILNSARNDADVQ